MCGSRKEKKPISERVGWAWPKCIGRPSNNTGTIHQSKTGLDHTSSTSSELTTGAHPSHQSLMRNNTRASAPTEDTVHQPPTNPNNTTPSGHRGNSPLKGTIPPSLNTLFFHFFLLQIDRKCHSTLNNNHENTNINKKTPLLQSPTSRASGK